MLTNDNNVKLDSKQFQNVCMYLIFMLFSTYFDGHAQFLNGSSFPSKLDMLSHKP